MKTIKEMLLSLKENGHYLIDREAKVVLTREQIGEAISSNYDDAIEALEANAFLDAFKVADKDMYNTLISLESKFSDPNQILFHLQYALNPNLPFSFKKIIFREISEAGRRILAKKVCADTIKEAMQLKLVSHYAKLKQLDEVREGVIEKIEKAENYMEKDDQIALYLLGYILADRKFYKFDDKKFTTIEALHRYLTSKNKLTKFANTMETDLLFIAWVYFLDQGEIYENWVAEVNRIDCLKYEEFYKEEEPLKYHLEKPTK